MEIFFAEMNAVMVTAHGVSPIEIISISYM